MKELYKVTYINKFNLLVSNYAFLTNDEIRELRIHTSSIENIQPEVITYGKYIHNSKEHALPKGTSLIVHIIIETSGKAHYERFLPCDYPSTKIYKDLGLI